MVRFLRRKRGEISMWGAIGLIVLVAAYLAYPQPFHSGVQWFFNTTFETLYQANEDARKDGPSIGNDVKKPKKIGHGNAKRRNRNR